VNDKMILHKASPPGYITLSHILYVDDIFVFYRADNKSLRNLSTFLETYGDFSGQYVNNSKSGFFTMDSSARFVAKIQRLLSCSHGCLPFNYLGVPIFVGAPECRFLQPLTDKVKLKLASWKGKSLNMIGQIQLVNTVITEFLACSFNKYKCFVSIFKQVEQWCRNFICTGDILKKGIATVNWAKIRSPLKNGGLKIFNHRHENNVYLLKLAWNFAYSNKSWSLLLKAEFLNQNISLEWFIDPHLFGLQLSSFMKTFLIILIGLLVQVLLLIFEMINGILLLLYQTLQG